MWDELFNATIAHFLPNLLEVNLPFFVFVLFTQTLDLRVDFFVFESEFGGLFVDYFVEFVLNMRLEQTEKMV